MSESTLEKGVRVFREEGGTQFTRKAIGFALDLALMPIFSTQQLEALAVDTVQIESAETITITYDGPSKASMPALLARMLGKVTTSPRFVCRFENVKLFGSIPVINVGWKFFYSNSVGNSRNSFYPSKHSVADFLVPRQRTDYQLVSGFLIGGERSGFAQWFYEQLPKLYWYEIYCDQLDTDPELIISGDLSNWQIRSLELLGYPQKCYTNHNKDEVVAVETLLVPPHPLRTRNGEFQICPSAIHWVGNSIRSNISPASKEFPKRIYVSRADADRRQVINEKEVVTLAEKYGFDSFEPGRLPFDEQVQLFHNAEVIIGPHGAGLTNIIFSNNAKIVEFMTEFSGEHFFVLANESNHIYEFLLCESSEGENTKQRHNDMFVDISALDQLLKNL